MQGPQAGPKLHLGSQCSNLVFYACVCVCVCVHVLFDTRVPLAVMLCVGAISGTINEADHRKLVGSLL